MVQAAGDFAVVLRRNRIGNLGIMITMIKLEKLNGSLVVVNAEIIESVEAAPDTVINLATGNKFIVKDSVDSVIAKVVEYKKQVYSERKCVNPIEGFERK
jgi:flagellar protein FlbD